MNPLIIVYKLTHYLLNLTTTRPLLIMAFGLGMRDFLFGLGFLLNFSDVSTTLIYHNFDGLLPGNLDAWIAGMLLLACGIWVIITALTKHAELSSYGLRLQAGIWLFNTIIFIINGQILLAIIIGLFFVIASGYLAFFFRYAPVMRAERAKINQVVKEHQEEDFQNSTKHRL